MSDLASQIQFIQASQSHLTYIVERTLALQDFESNQQQSKLTLSENFSEQIKSWLAQELKMPNSLIFIIQSKEKTIGFAFIKILDTPNQFTVYSQFGLIQSIWVDEAYRKQSVGQKIIAFIEAIFKEQSIEYYEVNYTINNQTAAKFWEKCGLIPTSLTARKFLTK